VTVQRRTAAAEPTPQKKESEAKGPIWINCPRLAIPPVLEGALLRAEETCVHRGDAPPPAEGPRPALVVLCWGGEGADREVRKLRALAPGSPVLVFGPSADRQLTVAALKAGARGFLHPGMASEEIACALSLAAEGVVVLPEELLIPGLIAKGLTIAQLEILSLSASGLSEARVAKQLSLSRSAVQRRLRGAYEALGIADEAQVASIFFVGGGATGLSVEKKQCTREKIA
jgi:DNA-binding NarL/FixJ family response regulator